jgi:hypothetical protein
MNYYHPILTRSEESVSVCLELHDSTKESSPLSTPRPVPDPTPCDALADSLTIKITVINFYGILGNRIDKVDITFGAGPHTCHQDLSVASFFSRFPLSCTQTE